LSGAASLVATSRYAQPVALTAFVKLPQATASESSSAVSNLPSISCNPSLGRHKIVPKIGWLAPAKANEIETKTTSHFILLSFSVQWVAAGCAEAAAAEPSRELVSCLFHPFLAANGRGQTGRETKMRQMRRRAVLCVGAPPAVCWLAGRLSFPSSR